MPFALALTLAALSTAQPVCSWDRPGANPHTGSVTAALDRYTDIPLQDRIALKHRMEAHEADDIVSIKRDSISGQQAYEPTIRDMHFGAASVCATVTRSKWAEKRDEPGAVYCVKDHCILVPRICGNVSRIKLHPLPIASLLPPPPPPLYMARHLSDRVTGTDLGLADADDALPTSDDELMRQMEQQIERTLANFAYAAPALPGDPASNAHGGSGDDGDRAPSFPAFPGDTASGDHGVSLPSAVPEADTWAMLLAGLGLLALVRRRAVRAGRG